MMTEKRKLTYIILSIMTVFLMVGRFLTIELGLLVVLFLGGFSRENRLMYIGPMEKSIGVIAFYTFFAMLLGIIPGFSNLFSFQEAVTEVERAIFYILIIQIVSSVQLDIRTYKRVWRLVLIIVVGICAIQYLKPFDIDSYLKRFYGETVQFINSARTDIDSFRAGSVFVNPNFMACFLDGYFGNYLVLSKEANDRLLTKVINYFLIFVGLILSGSRTGLMIAGFELLVFYMQSAREKGKIGVFRLLGTLTIVLALMTILFGATDPALGNLRAFQINEGLNSSLAFKLNIWKSVMSQAHAGNLLFGYGPIDYASDSNLLVDFELGYFTVFYGLFGLFLYFGLTRSIMRYNAKPMIWSIQRKRNLYFALIMVLFGFTSGLYLNLRLFSVFLVLFFPVIFNPLNVKGGSDEQICSA